MWGKTNVSGGDVLAAGETIIAQLRASETRTAVGFNSQSWFPFRIVFNSSGTVRLKFSLRNVSSAGGVAQWVKNGVNVGTQRLNASGGYVEYSEDFTVTKGDVFKLRFGVAGSPDGSSECAIQNVKACASSNLIVYGILDSAT